jgi:NAD(P)-dependent dehydrogenase (short-subunit alcohol dehydrogenase family)
MMTGVDESRRVALVMLAGTYVGPALCRQLADRGHDLVVHAPAPGQVQDLERRGASVELVDEVVVPLHGEGSVGTAAGCGTLVSRAIERFGRLDAAALSPRSLTPPGFTRGPFLDASIDDLDSLCGYFPSTFHALQATVRAMQPQRRGQILVFTSDAGARPEAGWSLYGSVRAGQSFLVQAVALEHAGDGISINALGSKNAVYDGFPDAPPGAVTDASAAPGRWSAPLEAETPLGRVGTMEELAAFAAVLLDGTSTFQTAQCFSFSGGWNTGIG